MTIFFVWSNFQLLLTIFFLSCRSMCRLVASKMADDFVSATDVSSDRVLLLTDSTDDRCGEDQLKALENKVEEKFDALLSFLKK